MPTRPSRFHGLSRSLKSISTPLPRKKGARGLTRATETPAALKNLEGISQEKGWKAALHGDPKGEATLQWDHLKIDDPSPRVMPEKPLFLAEISDRLQASDPASKEIIEAASIFHDQWSQLHDALQQGEMLKKGSAQLERWAEHSPLSKETIEKWAAQAAPKEAKDPRMEGRFCSARLEACLKRDLENRGGFHRFSAASSYGVEEKIPKEEIQESLRIAQGWLGESHLEPSAEKESEQPSDAVLFNLISPRGGIIKRALYEDLALQRAHPNREAPVAKRWGVSGIRDFWQRWSVMTPAQRKRQGRSVGVGLLSAVGITLTGAISLWDSRHLLALLGGGLSHLGPSHVLRPEAGAHGWSGFQALKPEIHEVAKGGWKWISESAKAEWHDLRSDFFKADTAVSASELAYDTFRVLKNTL